MVNQLKISKMQKTDIAQAVEIWTNQYKRYCGNNETYPTYWGRNTKEMEKFLNQRMENRNAIVVKSDKRLIGYLAYNEFPFHGEKSVYCPSIAHATIEEYKESAYLSLYKSISKEWVHRNVLNHMWTINYEDTELRRILFDLGFGSYVIDAFACADKKLNIQEAYNIEKAGIEDVDVLYELVEESRGYYSSAPLFLKREQYSKEDILDVIQKNNVFIARDKKIAIGFINVSISQRNNIFEMSVKNCGLIDEIGVYIKLEYRSKGLGKEMLNIVLDFCSRNNIQGIHVDFETANIFANKFWNKYFNPMLLSVRRTINKDINN